MERCSTPILHARIVDRFFNRWLTALDVDTDPGASEGVYQHADSETTIMDQLLCDPAPDAQPCAAGDQQAALGSSTWQQHLAAAVGPPVTTVDATEITCAESPKTKKNTNPTECSSPVVSPCLGPSVGAAMSDGIEYLDLNDSEMDKWPGVDPESRYQSALNYTVM